MTVATLLSLTLIAGTPAPVGVPEAALKQWEALLAAHVSSAGLVDYRAIEARDLAKLDAFLGAVATAKVPDERNHALAFYGDAYNALVIRAVITARRPRSVLDVPGFFDKKTYVVAGREVTLDVLEKKLAAPLGSPGHHFIFVCGAMGCPKLGRTPLMRSAATLPAVMDAAARTYLATPRGAIAAPGDVQLSKIFEWYAADFGGPAGVLEYARARLPARVSETWSQQPPKVRSLEYDWTLNQP